MKKTAALISLVSILLVVTALLTGCAGSAKDSFSPNNGYYDYYDKETVKPDSDVMSGGLMTSTNDLSLVIMTATETVETEHYDELIEYVRSRVNELGGYISDSEYVDNSYSYAYSRMATVTVRIPAEHYGSFIGDLGDLGTVTYLTENVEDVTLEYIDIDSRITVLRSEETALSEMLAKAENVSDMLTVRRQLEDVQSDLASLTARRDRLDRDIAYSTVNMSIREVKTVAPADVDEDEPSFGEEVGEKFLETVTDLGNGVRAFAVWFIGNSPYILIWAGVIVGAFFLIRYIIRRRKAGKRDEKTDR